MSFSDTLDRLGYLWREIAELKEVIRQLNTTIFKLQDRLLLLEDKMSSSSRPTVPDVQRTGT